MLLTESTLRRHMNGYVVLLLSLHGAHPRRLGRSCVAQLFMNCTDDELQSHARKSALRESLGSWLIDWGGSVLTDSKTSTPKPKTPVVLPSPSDGPRSSLHLSSLTPSTPQQSSTRLAGE